MNYNNYWRRITTGALMGCVVLACCGGCTKTEPGNEQPQANASVQAPAKPAARPAVAVPERKPVDSEPTFTFNFGDTVGKAYELKGVDLSGKEGGKKTRTGAIVAMQDAVYLYESSKPINLLRVDAHGETLSDLKVVGDGYAINCLATNGKVVLYKNAEKKLAVYDGTKVSVGKPFHGAVIAGCQSDGDFYFMKGRALVEATLEGTELTNERELFDLGNNAELKDLSLGVCAVDGDTIFMRGTKKVAVDGAKKRTSLIVALDKQGQEICRYEGFDDMPRGWAVTANYVVATSSPGKFRVFDRASGQTLGNFELEMRPFALSTLRGNDVIVYDDRSDKLYRFDF